MKLRPPPPLGRLRKVFQFDKETGLFYYKITVGRHGGIKGNIAGFIRKDGYWSISLDGKSYLGHRLAWYYVYGVWLSEVDHKDRIRSNNAIRNLRGGTRTQNNGNSNGWGSKKKSGLPRGVYFHPADKTRFRAQIFINYKPKHLGCFNSVEEARAAYKVAALEHFGEFAE